MPCNYQELEIKPLQVAATLCAPSLYSQNTIIKLEDSADNVMTDLKSVVAVTISPSANLDEANDLMIKKKIRLLFVIDARDRIIGLITYSDLQGERPIQFQQSNGVQRSEICVLDIMTGIDSIDVMEWSAVKNAKVGDVLMTMKKLHRQHALVLDNSNPDAYQVRGIFSISMLSKSLGLEIDTTEIANSFAEFERVLACN
ncbi:MAG: CBS domain-containing protein [gamma proteobacterium symbiont of Taylorina sp.]|nr:CBS domain-containing protein [gamma proteobacterium symbiont of Taylorina sp.]